MLSLLKMDVLRLVKSRSFYIILGVTAALIVSLVLMVAGISAPEVIDAMAAQGAEIDLEDQQTLEYIKSMDQLAFVHETLGSGFLLVIAGIGMTLFAGGDFSSGYIKNICFARPRRWDYVLSKLLLAGVYSGLLTALGVLLSLLSPRLVGLRLAAAPLSQLTGYAVLMWLPRWAFSLTLVLLTRSSTLGIILSLVSGGDLTVILAGALCGRLGLPPVEQYFLSSVVRDLCAPQTGAAALILACAAGWSVLYAAVSLAAIKNQDI